MFSNITIIDFVLDHVEAWIPLLIAIFGAGGAWAVHRNSREHQKNGTMLVSIAEQIERARLETVANGARIERVDSKVDELHTKVDEGVEWRHKHEKDHLLEQAEQAKRVARVKSVAQGLVRDTPPHR